MDIEKQFPEGLATGNAFLNREEERAYLAKRIQASQHTVLMAPRRYGKTSLVLKVAEELDLPHKTMDLFAAYSEEYIRDQIINKIGKLVLELLPPLEKAKAHLLKIFKTMKPEISLGGFGQRLVLHPYSDSLQSITDLLLKLDETAVYFNKKVVVFIDEFQQISELKHYHAIEASIRHAVERSKNVAYVFSGSNRHLLNQMFGDKGRPLYRLCQILELDRIHSDIYIKHLKRLSKKQWGYELSQEVISLVLELTERHSFYMNVFCQKIWEEAKAPAHREEIEKLWHNYVQTQRRNISLDVMKLSANQRKILIALAQNGEQEIQSTDFITPLKISASSAKQALDVLTKKDFVMHTNGIYEIIDPAIKYYLQNFL